MKSFFELREGSTQTVDEETQVYRINHPKVSGNVHAKSPEHAMDILRKKGVKGKVSLTHKGPLNKQPGVAHGKVQGEGTHGPEGEGPAWKDFEKDFAKKKVKMSKHVKKDLDTAKLENVASADKKPEVFVAPDGKKHTRMVPVDKEVVKKKENLDELKKSTLGSYIKKASQSAAANAYSAAQKATSNVSQSGKDYVKSVNRQKGIAKATDKLAKEAKLDELSPATHDRYQKAAHKSAVAGVAQMRMGTRTAKSMADNQKKRQAGIDTSKFLNRKQHGVKPSYEAVGEKPPFDGPYKKAGQVRKDRFGNVIKPSNVAKHLAKKAAASLVDKQKKKPLHAQKSCNEQTLGENEGNPGGMFFKVTVSGLPDLIMIGRSTGHIKSQLRKIVKQPSMITDVDRMTRAEVKKRYRDLALGDFGDDDLQTSESTQAYGQSVQAIADKKKKDAISSSDKDKLGKLAAMMAKEKKPEKNPNKEAYRPPTQAEIDADKKKDQKRTGAVSRAHTGSKQYKNFMGGLKK
jgi:hypothetical protein